MATLAEISKTPEGFRGERCWFQVIAENEDEDLSGWYRRFAIIRLTADQLAEEERWHRLFRENVGWHTDYMKEAADRHEGIRPREQWNTFYEPYKTRVPLDVSSNEVLAWFEH